VIISEKFDDIFSSHARIIPREKGRGARARFDSRRKTRRSHDLVLPQTGYEAGIMLKGKLTHRKTINSKYGTSDIGWLQHHVDAGAARYEGKPKYKYLLPLDDEMAERVKSLCKPYPNAPQAKRTLRLECIQERAV
jgi:hypothetical protein